MLKKTKKKQSAEDKKRVPGSDEVHESAELSADQVTSDKSNTSSGSIDEKSEAGSSDSAEEESVRIKNQYIRLMADFDNYRKRQAREREDFVKRSNERLLGDILPVVDHLELALKKVSDPEDPFAAGVSLVYDQLQGVLKRWGLTPIEARGEEFNPERHEALSYIPSPTVPANQVIDQFRCGWDLSGHLMRPAQVMVSSGKPDEAARQECVSD